MKTACGKSFPREALKQGGLIVLIALAISLSVNFIRSGGLPLLPSPSSKAAANGSRSSDEPLVTMEEARALFLAHGAVFIDARPEQDYRSGHIQGALNLPANSFDRALPSLQTRISPDAFLIAYCDGEHCSLSREVAAQLVANGFSHVAVFLNGWTLWRNAGLPVAKTR
ncbi:MAG: rhodanese-like domain-containing protein [Syntrophobacteraceae bacterium]|nr:rhodanese-like domain-containing protein [Syntrophobacteraceae bacterium]